MNFGSYPSVRWRTLRALAREKFTYFGLKTALIGPPPPQLEVIWSLLLQADSEEPSLIFSKASQTSVR